MAISTMVDAVKGARVFYWAMLAAINFYFVYYKTELRDQIQQLNLLIPLLYFVSMVTSTYLLYTVGRRPGYIKFGIQQQLILEQTEETNDFRVFSSQKKDLIFYLEKNLPYGNLESQIPHQDRLPEIGNQMIMISNGIDCKDEENEGMYEEDAFGLDTEAEEEKSCVSIDKTKKLNNSRTGREIDEDGITGNDNDPPLHHCQNSEIFLPYRSKYCRECQAVVAKFDHHCFWLGGCVGELNHHKFWLMTGVMTFNYIMSFYYNEDTAKVNSGVQPNSSSGNLDDFSSFQVGNGSVFIAIMVICFFSLFFTGFLFLQHTVLVCTNSSTWENMRAEYIVYINAFPKGHEPFNNGFLQNIKDVFFHGNKLRIWAIPDVREAWSNPRFNWCNNKYYSCC